MPRLFSYGGTRFSERQRLGVWEFASVEPFNDATGVPDTGFGVGMLWDSKGAALLVRQQQKDSNGRPNVFSLLLDPELAVWERFHWNAAALALALFGEDGKRGEASTLLLRPEDITPTILDALLEKIENAAVSPENNSRFARIWAGAVAEEDLVVAPYVEAGWEAAPTLLSLGRHLASLPICFRGGTSWLIGGTPPQARKLKMQLVLNHFESNPLPEGLVERGQDLLKSWKAAVNASAELKALDMQPSQLWGIKPGLVFERAELMATFQSQQPDAETILPNLLSILDKPGPAAKDICEAAFRFAVGGDGPMSPARTKFVLSLRERIEGPSLSPVVARLDRETTISHCAEESVPMPLKFSLPVEWREDIWRRRLRRQTSVESAGLTLEEALKDLTTQEKRIRMIRYAICDCLSGSFLYEWLPFFTRHSHWWEEAADALQQIGRTDVTKATAESTLGYLCFGRDPGGHLLATSGLTRQAAAKIVKRLTVEAIGSVGDRSQLAQSWLKALAKSPFRQFVPLQDKLAAAHSIVLACGATLEWRWLELLKQSYSGLKGALPPERVPDGERTLLRQEFIEMLEHPPAHGVPQISLIQKLLGSIPAQLTLQIFDLAISGSQPGEWVAQLREAGMPDIAERVVAHIALRGRDEESRRQAFRLADEPTLLNEISTLVRDLGTNRRVDAQHFANCLESVKGDRQLSEKLAAVLRGVWASASGSREGSDRVAEQLLCYLARDSTLFVQFAAGFEPTIQLNMLRHLEQLSPQSMRLDAIRAARQLCDGEPVGPGPNALLRYLHSGAGDQLRRIAASDGYLGGAKAFERRLEEMFGQRRRANGDRSNMLRKILSAFRRRSTK